MGNFEDLPYVGDFGRQLLACANAEEAQALIAAGGASGFTPDASKTSTVLGIDDAGAVTYRPVGDTGKEVLAAGDAATARAAIGAGTSSFDGSYNSLKDKPAIPAAPTAATTAKAGLVRQASIADGADATAIITALKTAGIAVTPTAGDESAVDQPSGF